MNRPLCEDKKCRKSVALLLFLLISVVLLRLVFPGSAAFINDEPNLQLSVLKGMQQHSWVLTGLSGSQPIPYGPVPIWIYTVLSYVSPNLGFLWLVHALFQVAAFALVARVMLRRYGFAAAILPLFLAAVSPFLFFYSRLLWDNTWLMVFSALLLAICDYADRSTQVRYPLLGAAFVGVIGGLCVGTHLMSLPMVGICVLYYSFSSSVIQRLSGRALFTPVLTAGVVLVVMLLPYLRGLTELGGIKLLASGASAVHGDERWQILVEAIQMPAKLFSSGYFTDYVLRGSEGDIHSALGSWWEASAFFDRMGSVIGTFWPLLVLVPFFSGFLRKPGFAYRYGFELLLGSGIMLATFALQFFKAVEQHPHYYHYLWWPMGIIAAALLATMETEGQSGRKYIALFLILFAGTTGVGLSQTIYSVVHFNGTRGLGYGSTVDSQQKVIRSICVDMAHANKTRGSVSGAVAILPQSLTYFYLNEPLCFGREISFGGSSSDYKLSYSNTPEGSAELVVNGQVPEAPK